VVEPPQGTTAVSKCHDVGVGGGVIIMVDSQFNSDNAREELEEIDRGPSAE
jgi:hypothetical protein